MPSARSLSPRGSLHRLQQLIKPIERFVHAAFHAGPYHAIAIGNEQEYSMDCELGPIVWKRVERRRLEADVSLFGKALKLERVDQALGRQDFVKDAMEWKLVAILVGMNVAPRAATSRLKSL